MFFSKYLVLFTAIVVTSASPALKRQETAGPLCHYTMTPATSPGEIGLEAEMNYALGHELAVETGASTFNPGCTVDGPQDDGTYKTECSLAAAGLTNAQTAALIETWSGKVVEGSPTNGFIAWTIDAVECE
ncbi:hypothetical protein FPV67DRAFT_1672107 [Lyophyllum atratum]|nr:hypothetical protein FPV67DRAFT_1672107 [Lyophyllum atratum]